MSTDTYLASGSIKLLYKDTVVESVSVGLDNAPTYAKAPFKHLSATAVSCSIGDIINFHFRLLQVVYTVSSTSSLNISIRNSQPTVEYSIRCQCLVLLTMSRSFSTELECGIL